MNEHELLERYEALGDEADFLAAKPLFEQALAEAPDSSVLRRDYGYLLECHARNELRRAVGEYTRAIDLDPSADKARYQLNSAYAGLREQERAIAFCKQRLDASPRDVREYRFLASAYLLARDFDRAEAVVAAGLALEPGDRVLIAARGEVKAATGDPDGALADWRRALELDPDDIGPLYSSAFLLEREGRLDEARDAWQAVVEWLEARGGKLQSEWPKRELQRLQTRVASAAPAARP
jgi:tetratricopeptide (TPR) repeat protein